MGTAAVSCGHRHSRCVRVYVSESASSADRLLGGWQEMGFGVCSYKSGALVRERELLPCRVWDMKERGTQPHKAIAPKEAREDMQERGCRRWRLPPAGCRDNKDLPPRQTRACTCTPATGTLRACM